MGNAAFGTKHTCEACAERFYDLNRSPPVCFKCGVQQSPPKPRMQRPIRAASDRGAFSRRPMPVAAEEAAVADLVVDEADPPDDDDDAEIDDDDTEVVEIEIDVDSDEKGAA